MAKIDMAEINYNLAKKGSSESAFELLAECLSELSKVEQYIKPALYKYMSEAFRDVIARQDLSVAFLLKTKGKGNKKNDRSTSRHIAVIEAIQDELRHENQPKMAKTKKKKESELTRAIKLVAPKMHLTPDAASRIWHSYQRAIAPSVK